MVGCFQHARMRTLLFGGLAPLLAAPDDGCLSAFDGAAPVEARTRAAHELWIRECADCHGVGGAADGHRSSDLRPAPPDFTDPCRPVQDAWIARVILEGGASFNGNPAMRAYHDLDERPEVLSALVELVQGFRSLEACVVQPREPIVAPDQRD